MALDMMIPKLLNTGFRALNYDLANNYSKTWSFSV